MTPMMSSVTLPRTFCETNTMSAMTDSEPTVAAIVSASSPMYPSLLSATPPTLPESRMTSATPRLAPELMPSTEGPASGLRKTVCICRPLTANPAPATKAVSDWGTRDFHTMLRHTSDSSPVPKRICTIDCSGMATDPSTKLSTKKSAMEAAMSVRMSVVCRFITSAVGNKPAYGRATAAGGRRGSGRPGPPPAPRARPRRNVAT